jgi:hypothetical protein
MRSRRFLSDCPVDGKLPINRRSDSQTERVKFRFRIAAYRRRVRADHAAWTQRTYRHTPR